jgi:hypothetical protein
MLTHCEGARRSILRSALSERSFLYFVFLLAVFLLFFIGPWGRLLAPRPIFARAAAARRATGYAAIA